MAVLIRFALFAQTRDPGSRCVIGSHDLRRDCASGPYAGGLAVAWLISSGFSPPKEKKAKTPTVSDLELRVVPCGKVFEAPRPGPFVPTTLDSISALGNRALAALEATGLVYNRLSPKFYISKTLSRVRRSRTARDMLPIPDRGRRTF